MEEFRPTQRGADSGVSQWLMCVPRTLIQDSPGVNQVNPVMPYSLGHAWLTPHHGSVIRAKVRLFSCLVKGSIGYTFSGLQSSLAALAPF